MSQGGLGLFLRKKTLIWNKSWFLTGRATRYAFSIKKHFRTNRNQSVINTENDEKRNLKHFKRLKASQRSEATRNRRETGVGSLTERLDKSEDRVIKKIVWQDYNDFTLHVSINLQNDRVYGKGKKSDVLDENLLSLTKKMYKKAMVSATILWYGVTKTFFVIAMVSNLTKKTIANISRRICFLL